MLKASHIFGCKQQSIVNKHFASFINYAKCLNSRRCRRRLVHWQYANLQQTGFSISPISMCIPSQMYKWLRLDFVSLWTFLRVCVCSNQFKERSFSYLADCVFIYLASAAFVCVFSFSELFYFSVLCWCARARARFCQKAEMLFSIIDKSFQSHIYIQLGLHWMRQQHIY